MKKQITIQFHGYGTYDVPREKLDELRVALNLDVDLLLDLIDIYNAGNVPTLSINGKKVIREGAIPLGHIPTKIGNERFDKLVEKGIIVDK